MQISIKTTPFIPHLPIISYDLGIITQSWEPSEWDDRSQVVQVCPLMDYPKGTLKGHTYLIGDNWVLYMKRVLTDKAWKWWIQTDVRNYWMINRPSKWNFDGTLDEPAFENIGAPNNFVAMDKHTATHSRVVGKHSLNFPVNTLDPAKDNWFYKPTEYWMATAQKQKPPHEVTRIGDGTYFVYTPVIRQKPEQWIQKSRVEMFPKLPMLVRYEGKWHNITGYALLGASVYGYADGVYIPLRLVQFIGDLRHPCPEWKLNTRPVPPETKPEWVMLS